MAAPANARRWLKQAGWLLLLWCLGVAFLGGVSLLLRGVMQMVGLAR